MIHDLALGGPFFSAVLLPLVIPAHAGIRFGLGEFAWIPAFAGMTDADALCALQIMSADLFKGG
jgi:hypothetical protein